MKTSELTGAALDWAVHIALHGAWLNIGAEHQYSTDWAQGGPIIEREGIAINAHLDGSEWFARNYWGEHEQSGPTPLIAAMRCYVASKPGDEIETPKELTA